MLQRAATNGTAVDLSIRRSDSNGITNALRGVFVIDVGHDNVQVRRSDGTELRLSLDQIRTVGIKPRSRRTPLAYLLDLVLFFR